MVDAFIKLKSRGLDPSEQALTAYGNTAAAMGKDLNQFIEAVADAATGEFERLKEFGITAKSQGDKVRFTFRGITTDIQKNAKDIEGYLVNLGNVEFAGGMQEQMNTLSGVTSNFQDSIGKLALKIDSETGLTGALKRALRLITEFTNSLAGVARPIAEIEAEIAALQQKIAAGGRTVGGGRNNTGNTRDLEKQVEALKDELLAAQLISSDSLTIAKGVETLEIQVAEIQNRIASAQAAGAQRFSGSGRNRGLTDYGRDLQQLEALQNKLAAAKSKQLITSLPSLESELGTSSSLGGGSQNVAAALDPYKQGLEEVQRLLESIKTPQKIFAENVDKIDALLAAGKITQTEYNNALGEYERIRDEASGANEAWNKALADSERIVEANKTALQKLNEELARAQELFDMGLLSPELYEQEKQRLQGLAEQLNKTGEQMSVFADQAARNIQDAFADFLFDPFNQGLDDMLKNFLRTIQRMIAEQASAQLLSSAGGALAASGNPYLAAFGGLLSLAGGRAEGGPVIAGSSYLVGEKGPEIFTPPVSGNIIPNHELAAAGQPINMTFNLPGITNAQEAKRAQGALSREMKRALQNAQRYS